MRSPANDRQEGVVPMSTPIGAFEADVLAGQPALLVALLTILAMLGIIANVAAA
jgi:hypothetical protein